MLPANTTDPASVIDLSVYKPTKEFCNRIFKSGSYIVMEQIKEDKHTDAAQ